MKKFGGWVQIILCSLFLLLFTLALFTIISRVLVKGNDSQIPLKEHIVISIVFLIMVSLAIFGLINGIKKVRKNKPNEIVDYDKVLNINLTGQIGYADYRNLIMGLTFKKPVFIVVLVIMLFWSTSIVVKSGTATGLDHLSYFMIIMMGVFLLTPVLTLAQIKKLYNSNRVFQENLHYVLTNDSINIHGSTVDTTQKWTHFNQMRETKNFFMFYPATTVATLLDKKMFSEDELQDFRNFNKSLDIKRA